MSKVVASISGPRTAWSLTQGRGPLVIRDELATGGASVVSIARTDDVRRPRSAAALLTAPASTVYSVKRFRCAASRRGHEDAQLLPFSVRQARLRRRRIGHCRTGVRPPEISASCWRELKHRAEEHFRTGRVRFEVDARSHHGSRLLHDAQRTATRDAGGSRAWKLRIINETTAASLATAGTSATAAGRRLTTRRRHVRHLDPQGRGRVFQVLATNGDTHLGGDDIDALLTEQVLDEIAGSAPRNDDAGSASRDPATAARIRT